MLAFVNYDSLWRAFERMKLLMKCDYSCAIADDFGSLADIWRLLCTPNLLCFCRLLIWFCFVLYKFIEAFHYAMLYWTCGWCVVMVGEHFHSAEGKLNWSVEAQVAKDSEGTGIYICSKYYVCQGLRPYWCFLNEYLIVTLQFRLFHKAPFNIEEFDTFWTARLENSKGTAGGSRFCLVWIGTLMYVNYCGAT